MPSLLDMRRRIKSVKNTQQITKAMKMVAAAKLKRAQDRVTAARPLCAKNVGSSGDLSAQNRRRFFIIRLLDARGDEKYLIVLVSADKGLAGAFNANVIKATQAFLNENRGQTAVDDSGRAKRTRLFQTPRDGFHRRIRRFDRNGTRRYSKTRRKSREKSLKLLRKIRRLIKFFLSSPNLKPFFRKNL